MRKKKHAVRDSGSATTRAHLLDFKPQQVGVCGLLPPRFGFGFRRHPPRQLGFGGPLPACRGFDELVALLLGVARRLPLPVGLPFKT